MDRILRTLAIGLFSFAAAGAANALEEHNPLDKLEESACKPYVVPPGVSLPSDGDTALLKVPKNDVLKAAIGKNGLPPPKSLEQAGTYVDLLADVMIPCTDVASQTGGAKPSPGERVNACQKETDSYQRSEGERYGTDEVRAIRQNLLRLFESGTIGGTKSLVVVKRFDVPEFPGEAPPTSNAPFDWKGYRPFNNRYNDDYALLHFLYGEDTNKPQPGKDSAKPQQRVGHGPAPFEIFCRSRTYMHKGDKAHAVTIELDPKKYPDLPPAPNGQFYAARKAAGDAGTGWNLFKSALRAYELTKEEETETPFIPGSADAAENRFASKAVSRINLENVATSGGAAARPALKYTRATSSSVQLVLAKDADQFIKDQKKRDGAEFGTTIPKADDKVIDSGNVEFAADAVFGLHYRLGGSLTGAPACPDRNGVMTAGKNCADGLPRPKYQSSWTLGFTPYAAISQESQQMMVYAENKDKILELKKKKFDYAQFSYGARIDYKSRLAPRPLVGSELDSADEVYSAALDRPGWGWGAYGEYIIDNHNLLNARRFGAYIKPPADWFGAAGSFYGQPYPFDVRSVHAVAGDRQQGSYSWWDDLWAGWYLQWDASFMAEDLDHIRLPRKFEAAPCYDPELFDCDDSYVGEIWIRKKPDEIVDGGVYGTDLSLSFGRYELFGLGKDDLFAELTAKWVYRHEWNNPNAASHWDLGLKVQDPTSTESRYWKIEYAVGENYVAGTEEERVSFKIVLAN